MYRQKTPIVGWKWLQLEPATGRIPASLIPVYWTRDQRKLDEGPAETAARQPLCCGLTDDGWLSLLCLRLVMREQDGKIARSGPLLTHAPQNPPLFVRHRGIVGRQNNQLPCEACGVMDTQRDALLAHDLSKQHFSPPSSKCRIPVFLHVPLRTFQHPPLRRLFVLKDPPPISANLSVSIFLLPSGSNAADRALKADCKCSGQRLHCRTFSPHPI